MPIIDSDSNQIDGFSIELLGTLEIKMISDGHGGVKSISYSFILPDSKLPVFGEIAGSVAQNALHLNHIN